MRRITTFSTIVALIFTLSLVGNVARASDDSANSEAQANSPRPWQLRFEYDQNALTLVEATPIPSLRKSVRTPGLDHAPVKVGYNLTWLGSSGQSILATDIQVPLGIRSTLGEGEACREVMPEQGSFVVRILGPGPDQTPASVRLEKVSLAGRAINRLPLPPVFENGYMTLPIGSIGSAVSAFDGLVNITKIKDSGPDENRLVIVVMGDGFTGTNLSNGDFAQATIDMVLTMGMDEPWDQLMDVTNIYRVDVESNEAGADNEVYGVYKDTYFSSSFWVNDIERLLALTGTGPGRAYSLADLAAHAGMWDVILVLVNSTKYGGSGGGIATSSMHSAAPEIVVHELGHSFADLADEYETEYSGFPPGDGEPNVDFDASGPGLKWLAWVDPGTPLPTPEASPYLTVVGAFEGARYLSSGIYRPVYNCKMRSLGPDFGPICQEAHLRSLCNMVTLTDSLLLDTAVVGIVGSGGLTVGVEALPLEGLTYEWTLDGAPVAGPTGQEWTMFPEDMTDSVQVLSLEVRFDTPKIRLDTISESYRWTIKQIISTTCCLAPSVGDCDCSGGIDVSDIQALIDNLFLSLDPLCCEDEGDIDFSGVLDVTDLSILIDNQFLTLTPLPPCP